MKIILNLFVVICFSILLISCKSDDVITNPGTASDSYEWSTQNITFDNITDIQVIDRNSYFASSFNKLYKVTNNVPVEFTEQNSVFNAQQGYIYDNSYIVYKGKRVSDGKQQFMIYDNGSYTIYNQPQPDSVYIFPPMFAGRGKFYCYLYDSLKYYKFENGIFTPYNVTGQFIKCFAKSNGNIYLIVRENNFTRSFYRVTDSGPVFVKNEPEDDSITPINTDILKISSYTTIVSYFSESAWTNMFTITNPYYNYPSNIRGESKDRFVTVRQDSLSRLQAAAWNGTEYKQLTDIPASVNFQNAFLYITTEYRDNTFYMLVINKDNTSKVIRNFYKGN